MAVSYTHLKLITVYEFGTPPINGTTRFTGDMVVENQKVVDMIDYTYYGCLLYTSRCV